MSFANRASSMLRVHRLGLVASVAAFTMMAATVPAWGDLSQADLGAIATAVASALASSSQGGPAAMASALASLTTTDVNQYGAANASIVASAIIADAIADGDTSTGVGQAMGQAALASGAPASNDIADAVGGSGNTELLAAFDASVSGAPGGAALEAEADDASYHRKAPLIGGVTVGGGVSGAGAGFGAGLAVCVNPSCT